MSDQTTAGAAGEPRSADEIRVDIEETREQLGETVEALAGKTDVKAQAHDRIEAAKDRVTDRLGAARQKADGLVSRAGGSAPDSAGAGVQQVTSTVQRKPLPFAVLGAFMAGVVVGRLLGRR